jgi:hypothetical protein
MQTSSNIAFKEWAVVVDALGRGQQVIILRKGGIIEDKGQFAADHDQFWLFPTLFHQQMESVVPEAQRGMEQFQTRFQSEGNVQIQFFVKAEKVIECADLDKVRKLRGQHIWKDSVIEDRFHYSKKNGIHLILTRVYQLPAPRALPLLPAYGGCKSWVELEIQLSTEKLKPVLSDAEFQSKADRVLASL